MNGLRILYICQEITPYLPATQMSSLCRAMSQAMQERGNEIRTFMPRYGVVNERRNQLHEVIRLSGMNLILDDNDHQLIIKVASIPAARVQIYFIDNDDYFSRKAVLSDPTTGTPFADNDERAMFFARGVLETVRKLRWSPDVVHCVGWFSGVAPLYLKQAFADDPLFKKVKVVYSICDDAFDGELNADLRNKLEGEGLGKAGLDIISQPSYENFTKLVIDNADGIIIENENVPASIADYLTQSGKAVLPWQDKSDNEYFDKYKEFYEGVCKK